MKDKAKVFKTVMFSALGVLLAALIFFCGYFTFYLTLSDEDMQAIRSLDLGHSLFFSHYDPQTVKWLCDYGKSK